MLSHHLGLDCPNTPVRRTTRAERRAIGAMIGLSALIVVLALQSTGTGIIESDAVPGAVTITGQ